MSETPLRAGVIGVGSMGQNHARVYDEIRPTTLAGVFDVDDEQAASIAREHETTAMGLEELLETVDVATVAVPTEYHYDMARQCIEHGVDVLVEKPFVAEPAEGEELIELAERAGVTVQVGHIERFNPAVITLREFVDDLDVISVSAERLGPPLEREIDDSVVMDLMIHDIDIVLDLIDGELTTVNAVGTDEGRYASANLSFDSGVVGHLTASRVTQEKVRGLTISARDCRVKVDYIDQTVEVHRASTPEYLREGGNVHYRHENLVERVTVDRREPLKEELRAFADAAANGTEPVVTAEDGLQVLETTTAIEQDATRSRLERAGVPVNAGSD
ncbi:Gfo/Idh/MocA family oxidoreductase (plasmid) [Halorarum halophilum]|uniref:Gfo/Idh/MocA family oxidoreductase n=1 Tax=Halorarum halophilum TaxID=2743090 RepID=A0A7D5GP56_9EURY|nr:Gfo/Idh/MocA family oxidoreductase [Halobaculum halophilum]QLG29744.1 Gfo/Idh/MocA family oxidoreductase [Halobaculum halophilum]